MRMAAGVSRETEFPGEPVEVPLEAELGANPRLTGRAERSPARGLRNQILDGAGKRRNVVLLYQHASDAVAHQLGDRRDPRRDAGDALALRLGKHVRQAVAIAVARDAAREREDVGGAVFLEDLLLRHGAAPDNAIGDAERLGSA